MLKKKCYVCNSYFDIVELNQENYICDKNGKKFSHFDCELEVRKEKNEKKKTKKCSNDELLKYLVKDQKKSVDILKREFEIQSLYEFIYKNYYIVSIPIAVQKKIQKLIDGNMDGISKPIPPEEIIDMWKRKKNELDRIYQYNKTKGKELDKASRVSYDLAVLINKYDSYLEWKEKEKVRATTASQLTGILETSVGKYKKEETNNENDIADILDDLF